MGCDCRWPALKGSVRYEEQVILVEYVRYVLNQLFQFALDS